MAKSKKSSKTKLKSKKSMISKKKPVKKSTKSKKRKVSPIPKGYYSLTAYLIVNDGIAAIDFYKKAFSAKEIMRMEQPAGKIGHAELKIGDTMLMLANECPEMNARDPKSYGGSPVTLVHYTKDVDSVVQRALNAGAKLIRAVETMFYGDRSGMVEDPFGHKWVISTHVEDVSLAETKKRAEKLFGNG